MEHTSKGQIKIVEKCNLPLTASCEVNLIITEKCVFRVLKNSDGTPDGLLLEEINPMFTVDDIKTTGCDFKISENWLKWKYKLLSHISSAFQDLFSNPGHSAP